MHEYRSSSLRRSTLTERKPEPTGVVVGPLMPTPLRLIESSVRSGNGVPSSAYTSSPAGCSSQSNSTPVASSTRRVASTSSGPVPSPGMIVTLYAMRRAMLSVGWRASFLPMSATIDVLNQAPPLSGYDPLEQNRPLDEGLEREGGGWARDDVAAFGRRARQPEVQDWARLANENPPRLRTHDRHGR